MRLTEVRSTVARIAMEYPQSLRSVQLEDVERIVFHVSLILDRKGSSVSVVDIGGGIGMFSVACAALGMQATLVDDFNDEVNRKTGDQVLRLHKKYSVRVVRANVIEKSVKLAPDSYDVVTCFDAMEHFHHSPRALFWKARKALRPRGLFVVGVPNCVNLRKRITVPFGHGKWSTMHDWYEQETFRGHVREPDVSDLLHIANDLGLKGVEIFGRNWLGLGNPSNALRNLTRLADRIIRLNPRLCSNIYLVGMV